MTRSVPRLRRRAFLAGAGLAVAGDRFQATARPRPLRFDFEGMPAGAAPPGFDAALTGGGPPPRWVVLQDPSSPVGSKVLAETSRDRTKDRFPLALLDGFAARDAALSVRFRPVDGLVDQAAGLVLRCRDARNYYVARADALQGNVRLYRVVGGRRVQIDGASARVWRGGWQTLALRLEGERFEASLDGRTLFSATDRSFAEAGRVGLWTEADSLTHFDGLEVEALR